MLKRIAITGPESTGKSWLAAKLAKHYNTLSVPEFAVEYLSEHGEKYSLDDIVEIAKGQIEREDQSALIANNLLFCDTDILVTLIWSREVFKEVPQWIDEKLIEHKYDLYLLCYPDIDWKQAPFRENPGNRDYLFTLYEKELIEQGFNYRIVKGFEDQRLKNAVNFVDELI